MGAAAALGLDEDASITAARNLGNDTHATATCNWSEDTDAAAAKEKSKRRDVMSKSQENKNEKNSDGHDEIRRLVEEMRNTAKREKHQLKELSTRITKCIRERKRTKNDKKRYNRFKKNLETSKVLHA